MSADIRQQIHERIDNTDICAADKSLLELLIGATAEDIVERNTDTLWILTLTYSVVSVSYRLGLTVKHDTALETGTKLLEGLNEK